MVIAAEEGIGAVIPATFWPEIQVEKDRISEPLHLKLHARHLG